MKLKKTVMRVKKVFKDSAYLKHYYNEEIVAEYLKTYVNARYYNIRNTDKPARAFYLRIIDELEFKEQILLRKAEKQQIKLINNVKKVYTPNQKDCSDHYYNLLNSCRNKNIEIYNTQTYQLPDKAPPFSSSEKVEY